MPGWTDVLQGITRAFREQRDQVEQQATQLTNHLNLRVELAGEELTESPPQIRSRAATALLQSADRTHGGFGGAPKFPQPFYLQLLVQQALDQSASNRHDARRHLAHSLRQMAEGGIYDQLAGGFHRYAVDEIWLVPHFEKMLYDNALLIPLYLDAHRMAEQTATMPSLFAPHRPRDRRLPARRPADPRWGLLRLDRRRLRRRRRQVLRLDSR